MPVSSASFRAMGTEHTVTVSNGHALQPATDTACSVIRAIDYTCSRFREWSELSEMNRKAGSGPVKVSKLLGDAIDVALDAAAATDGLVDPTVGSSLCDLGYVVTYTDVPVTGPRVEVVRVPTGWMSVIRDRSLGTVSIPAGTVLDLGATGKAWAADLAARAAADRISEGVIVACGGDVAAAGPPPPDGWRVRVSDDTGFFPDEDVQVFEGGLATSAPRTRSWRRGGQLLHHIIDPATGRPVPSPWAMVTVAASTCAGANAAATAAIVLGDRAPVWLAERGMPARLLPLNGTYPVTTGEWPSA